MNELNFGQFIRKERMALGLSLSGVATELKCSAPYLSLLENGKQKPSEEMIKKLAIFFEVDIIELKKRVSIIDIENTLRKIPAEHIEAVMSFYKIKKQAASSSK
jgi:transcriptional regulator with XRE-family HTH domain